MIKRPDYVHNAFEVLQHSIDVSKDKKVRAWHERASALKRYVLELEAQLVGLDQESRDQLKQTVSSAVVEAMTKDVEHCWKSKKVIFPSKSAATKSKGRGKSDRLRVYQCPDCLGWHLTSRV